MFEDDIKFDKVSFDFVNHKRLSVVFSQHVISIWDDGCLRIESHLHVDGSCYVLSR